MLFFRPTWTKVTISILFFILSQMFDHFNDLGWVLGLILFFNLDAPPFLNVPDFIANFIDDHNLIFIWFFIANIFVFYLVSCVIALLINKFMKHKEKAA